jgi:ribokinase
MASKAPRIVVVGSINMDLLVRCPELPLPGETVLAQSAEEFCGGKGANQAVAAARAGGSVAMVGRVGSDAFAARLLENLVEAGIATQRVQRTEGVASGLAVVQVDDEGENAILVVAGANGQLSAADIERAGGAIAACDMVLFQLETPLETVLAAKRRALQAGVRVILDPAPAPRDWPSELLEDVALLCPNAYEASMLTGMPVEDLGQAEAAGRRLRELGARAVAVTLGAQGALLLEEEACYHLPAYSVSAVDTTAAGDAFAGALAVRWAEGASLSEAVRFANAAGALSASQVGAQPSMATRQAIEGLVAQHV